MSIESIQKVGSFQGAGNVVYQNLVGSPTTGDLWFDYSNVALKMYNGVEWTAFSNTTGDITGVTAGLGLSGGGLSGVVTLDLDFSELTNMTGDISGSTEFIIQDATTESRKAASGIKLSAFNNDSGWTDNDGTVTSIATSGTVNGITLTGGPITDTGTITLGGTLSGIILTQLDPAAVILSSESFADINTAVLTAAATDDRILSYGYSTTTGTVTSIATSGTVNGITLTGGTITEDGTITLGGAINNLLLNQFDPAAVILGTESFLDTDTAVLTAAATDDRILSYGYSTTTGTVTSIGVSGGAGLTSTGGPITSSGTITLAVGAGTGLTVNADDIAITNTGVTAQQYGDAATIPVVTVNAQGQITLASELSIAIDASQITSGTIDTDRLTDVTLDNVTDNGNTTTNDITVGNLTSTGIDDNATSTAITINSAENVTFVGEIDAGESRFFQPATFWSSSTAFFGHNYGSLGTQGSFDLHLTANGYRNSSGTWTSLGVNSQAGASQIALGADGKIEFNTDATKNTGDSHTLTTRMTLTNDGKLGIGQISPLYTIDAKNVGGAFTAINIEAPDDTTPSHLFFSDSANAVGRITYDHSSDSMLFRVNGSERFRIDSTGDLIMNGGAVQTTILTTGSSSTAGTMIGDWTLPAGSTFQATYADLAEKYTTDAEYESGTVMKFGGDAELTQSDTNNDHKVAGVLSTNPAYILNAEIEGQYLALSGRVPVKVTGSVCPGDILVSSNVPGHAEVNNNARSGRIIGKAITNDANGVCEALVTLM